MSAAVAEKIEIEKINSAPSSGETGQQRGPMSRTQGGSSGTTTPESFVILGRPVWTLFDFFEISKWAPMEMHGRDRLLYTRARPTKTLTTESNKNSSTTIVNQVPIPPGFKDLDIVAIDLRDRNNTLPIQLIAVYRPPSMTSPDNARLFSILDLLFHHYSASTIPLSM